MKITYKHRIFLYFFVIFTIFTIGIVIIEQKEERSQRTQALEARLASYADIINTYINQFQPLDSGFLQLPILAKSMPMDIRMTVINKEGNVIFDKDVQDVSSLDNHLDRPEIRNASYQTTGTNIRMSTSTHHEYLYFAKNYDNYYIRVALPYTVETKSMLKADNLFIYAVIIMFIIILILLNYVAGRFGKSISQLKVLTTKINEDKPLTEKFEFPDDELGEIGSQLVDILNHRAKNKQEIESEREKLIQHFQYAHEGICIFDSNYKKIYANTNFFQYMNLVSDQPIFNLESILKEPEFHSIVEFLNTRNKTQNFDTFQIKKNGKTFLIQTVVFEDNSFEITIKDVSKAEKTRLLKQEMTNNIAHELRTPVTSLRGYLETLSSQSLAADKQSLFIDRAYKQSLRLSNLIEDISLISKIEEASPQFSLEKINISQLINEVRIDLTEGLEKNDIKLNVSIKDNLTIEGNYTLLYSIFRNLIDNTISYAGQHVSINIANYMEDSNYLYFSYHDTGHGVAEEHLSRLFERFYRVNEGRTREIGGSGSGLGLSIVKNAILFHKGEIHVKNRSEGGLEFFFTLKK